MKITEQARDDICKFLNLVIEEVEGKAPFSVVNKDQNNDFFYRVELYLLEGSIQKLRSIVTELGGTDEYH